MEPDLTEQLPVAAVGVRPGDKEQPSPGVSPVKLPRDAVKCHRPGLVRLAVTTDTREPGPESGWKASILGCLRLEFAKYIVLK